MLAAIGAAESAALLDEIPAELLCKGLEGVPPGLSEMDISKLMRGRARQDGQLLNFLGAGAYEHHIPAAVWEITTRGEFYSAYTPYQAEASQGTLQLLAEYQSMMTALTGMEVSNASMYDGASALAEALLMAARANPARRSHPRADAAGGTSALPPGGGGDHRGAGRGVVAAGVRRRQRRAAPAAQLARYAGQGITAVVIPQPNFFGVLEDVDALTDWATPTARFAVAAVNPLSLAVLKPPGEWGSKGADIACGEGQPLGVPLASGGPYFGVLTAKQAFVRQMPGRIVGRTVDLDGKPGFTLTLQAREQHIRRAKATSNICTNQGLLVTAATIHMSLLGAEGLARVAAHSMANTRALVDRLAAVPGVAPVFSGERFHEAVLCLPRAPGPVLEKLAKQGILGGLDLSRHYPELGDAILVCATETKTEADIDRYAAALAAALKS